MYTWKKKWLDSYESPWGIINKFMYANKIHGRNAANELTTLQLRNINIYRRNLAHTGIVSNYQLLDNFWCTEEESLEEYGTGILQKLLKPLLIYQNEETGPNYICNMILRETLYYCPDCMKYGNHFMFHQFTFMKRCLIHDTKLTNTCPECKQPIPYVIDFENSNNCYQCKYCKSYLFNNNDFGEILDSWLGKKESNNLIINMLENNEIPFIISNNPYQTLEDNDINDYLFSLYTKNSEKTNPKYIIKKGFSWNDMEFGEIITPNLSKERKIQEYVYIYAYQSLYRHITRSKHLRHKLNKAEEFIRNYCLYYPLMSTQVVDYGITHNFEKEAIILYLWKRDMEYDRYSKHFYSMNKKTTKNYSFDPDYEILDYLEKIYNFLPMFIDDNYKFSIMVHIAITLMKEKYNNWVSYMNNIYNSYDLNEILKKLNHISLRNYSKDYNKHFFVVINQKEQIYKLYFSMNNDNI